MSVFVLKINYSGWEDLEANGCQVELYKSREKATEGMAKAVEEEIKEEKEFGREFEIISSYEDYVLLRSQYDEHIEFEVEQREFVDETEGEDENNGN